MVSEKADLNQQGPAEGTVSTVPPRNHPKAWVSILPELCKGCELCVYACPSGNLEMSESLNRNGYHPVVFNYRGRNGPCTACGICHVVCPDFAISKVWRVKKQ